MQHIKIIKREDGSKVEIMVSLSIYFSNQYWNYSIGFCYPGKRKFEYGNMEAKATPDEIYQAKLELWELLKPQKP